MERIPVRLIAVLAISAVLLSSSPSHATPPGQNGRIAFRVYFNTTHSWGAIFTINPDGTGLRQVTHPPRGIVHTEPDWSPNGRWIVYTKVWGGNLVDFHPQHPARIFRIHPNGAGRRDLSKATCHPDTCVSDYIPAWSPNGKRIAFVRVLARPRRDSFIFIMRADGTHPHQITDPPSRYADDLSPTWSPDGTRLVFNRFKESECRCPTADHDAIFTVRADGTHERQLTPWKLNCTLNPDWSPNGRWILFTCHRGDRTNLWLVHPNGTELQRITSNPDGEFSWFSSTFSPDGTMIVTSRSPGVGKAGNADVYLMNPDGTGLVNVTNSSIWDSAPDWGPWR